MTYPAHAAAAMSGAASAMVDKETSETKARLFGISATIVHRTDHAEHGRRRGEGLGHLDSMELLDVLMELPLREALPLSSIDPSSLRVLRRAPAGVVEFTGRSVTRLVVPAVTPLLAVVHAVHWRDGLERASAFAAHCPRMFVTRELPENADEVLAEASWYGVGVAVGPRAAPTVVLEPEPLSEWRPSVAWWRFCERVYRHALDR
ncbi:hypothetical protein IOD16_23745 [Saccharothrix sp. 6-C]|uniref:hypothetical protein n=1 Tax=Saccharothrix sp. 6-C TaxID=2781735 RepID=UPI0019174469|nr:hypothetical protein [Saccharothrix sp. 6-C]QQQ74218.1 hypothetical protein IOD16_23745 [Saccharothrix sp. 6-C]